MVNETRWLLSSGVRRVQCKLKLLSVNRYLILLVTGSGRIEFC